MEVKKGPEMSQYLWHGFTGATSALLIAFYDKDVLVSRPPLWVIFEAALMLRVFQEAFGLLCPCPQEALSQHVGSLSLIPGP